MRRSKTSITPRVGLASLKTTHIIPDKRSEISKTNPTYSEQTIRNFQNMKLQTSVLLDQSTLSRTSAGGNASGKKHSSHLLRRWNKLENEAFGLIRNIILK